MLMKSFQLPNNFQYTVISAAILLIIGYLLIAVIPDFLPAYTGRSPIDTAYWSLIFSFGYAALFWKLFKPAGTSARGKAFKWVLLVALIGMTFLHTASTYSTYDEENNEALVWVNPYYPTRYFWREGVDRGPNGKLVRVVKATVKQASTIEKLVERKDNGFYSLWSLLHDPKNVSWLWVREDTAYRKAIADAKQISEEKVKFERIFYRTRYYLNAHRGGRSPWETMGEIKWGTMNSEKATFVVERNGYKIGIFTWSEDDLTAEKKGAFAFNPGFHFSGKWEGGDWSELKEMLTKNHMHHWTATPDKNKLNTDGDVYTFEISKKEL